MFGKDLLIKKYPYMGFSPNIMEYFSIIGYQENFVPILIEQSKKKKNPFSPTTLSSITSSIDYGIIDNELIINQVYPDNPLIIQYNKNDINLEIPSTSNVIYSFCFDTTDGKSKLFYTCFALKFYEKYIHKSNSGYEEYYIPKAFCIVSQYSFFTLFEYICKNIHTLMTKKNNVLPVELIIYNIVNFIPSPMSYNLYLDIFSFCLEVNNIEINQLSGYPYIDFDLKEVFTILPLNFFLEIYIFTIIEQPMLFFSSNLEILNMVMYVLYILNYPCNDSTYFWHIVSVSKDNLTEENKFVGKIMVSLLGVNTAYEESIDTSPFGKFHYIVDIDNKKMFLKESLDLSIDEKEDSDNLGSLHTYIQNIIKEKSSVESSFLKPFILKLKKNLEALIYKDTDQHAASKIKYQTFFRTNKSILAMNRKIQEIFYDFCLNILMIFYQDNALVSSFDKIKRIECNLDEQNRKINILKINDTNIDMSLDEKHFCYFFRGAIKYKIYFENFLQNLDTIDVFKIALLFSEEFINIKIKDIKNKSLNKLSLFSIIDTLYYPQKQQIINITISNLFSLSLDKLKKYFEEYNNNCEAIEGYVKPQLIDLNKKILNKYLFLLNNFYEKEEIMDLFPSIRIQEEQPIINFDRRYIINIIQNTFENHNLISTQNYLIYAVTYIFCISMSLHSYKKMLVHLETIISSLQKIKFFLRQYGYIILQTMFKYLLLHKEKQIYGEMNVTNIKMYYYMIITFLKQNNIIPNEEMMAIFTKFFGKMIFQERTSMHKKSNKEIDSEADFEIFRNVNFYCFMKHCFSNKKCFTSNIMIKSALKEINNCNIIIRSNKVLKPTVEIKINDYIYSTEFFSPKKIFKLSEICFNEFYENDNLDFSKLKIKNVRDCIANLIQYGLELKDTLPVKFLIYTLYLLRNYEEKYLNKKKEIEKDEENN